MSGNRPSFPIRHLFLTMCFLSATQTLLAQENSNYTTETFTFKIPEPWHYAIPEGGGKTVATCYLGSKLRPTAKGRFIVDTGNATASVEKIAEIFATRMVPKESELKVEKTTVKLGNVDAVLLKSDAKDYNIPCAAIICSNGGKLYMAMLSVSGKEDLKNRDVMLESLIASWTWIP